MDMKMTPSDVKALRRYPDLIKRITTAATAPDKELSLDLGELALTDTYAMIEVILLARTLGVRLVSLPDTASAGDM
jgi:hypothetical protein